MIRRIGAHQKTDSSQARFRIAALLSLFFTAAPLIQSQTTKPSDVFFFDPAHPDQRGAPYNIGTTFAPKNQKPAASIVKKGVVLRGWLAGGVLKAPHVGPNNTFLGYEDVHYDLVLDYDFINSTYGQNGGVLTGAVLPGNPQDSQTSPISLADPGNRTLSGIGINSFWHTYTQTSNVPLAIHMELNAWHARGSQQCQSYNVPLVGNVGCDLYENYAARGPAPAGWVEREFDQASSLPAIAADNWWPFDPDDPDGLFETGPSTSQPGPNHPQYLACFQNCDCAPDTRGKPNRACMNACNSKCEKTPNAFITVPTTVPKYLGDGDYVEVQGTLWQDVAHDAGTFWQNLGAGTPLQHVIQEITGPPPPPDCWGKPLSFHNQDGSLEIHPVDSIRRIFPPVPFPSPYGDKQHLLASAEAGVKRVIAVQLCSDAQGGAAGEQHLVCPEAYYDGAGIPSRASSRLVPQVLELVDGRFSNLDSRFHRASVNSGYPDCVNIQANLTGAPWEHFKASYVVWWTRTKNAGPVLNFPTLSATSCPTADGKSCLPANAPRSGSPLMDIVKVTSSGSMLGAVTLTNGGPVAGATISVSGQQSTAVTNASGIAVITYLPCYTGQVPKVGQRTLPVRRQVPCQATVSAPGLQPISISLP